MQTASGLCRCAPPALQSNDGQALLLANQISIQHNFAGGRVSCRCAACASHAFVRNSPGEHSGREHCQHRSPAAVRRTGSTPQRASCPAAPHLCTSWAWSGAAASGGAASRGAGARRDLMKLDTAPAVHHLRLSVAALQCWNVCTLCTEWTSGVHGGALLRGLLAQHDGQVSLLVLYALSKG